ncbi:peritrophin-48-like [Cochliomyia hominivorax]
MAKTTDLALMLLVLGFAHAEYDVGKYCQLVKTNTKLPSLTSCQTFYVCQGSNQYMTLFCPTGTYFNKNSQSCETSNDSCSNGVHNPCFNHNNQFVSDSKYCNEWHYCLQNAIASSGECPPGQRFSYENQSCIYGECSGASIGGNNNNNNVNSNNNNEIGNICQIMPEGQFFGDFNNCSNWHKCINMEDRRGHCLHRLVYDTVSGMCLEQTSTMCQRIDGGNAVEGTSGPPAGNCTVNAKVGDKNVCSIYYTCNANSQWIKSQCQQQYFDVISKECNNTELARAYSGCNRCQFTSGSLYWTNAVDTSCSKYFTCKNGQESKPQVGDCGSGSFFNEDLQSCMIGNFTLGEYSTNHGACQNYKCNDETQECTLINTNSSSTNEHTNGVNGDLSGTHNVTTASNGTHTASNLSPSTSSTKSTVNSTTSTTAPAVSHSKNA